MTSADTGRLRATRQGAALDAALAEADGFLTAQALHDELKRRDQAIGLTTVYRHLKRLAEQGDVDVVVRPDGEASYRRCGQGHPRDEADHHHHLVCRQCGRSVEVAGPEVERWAARVADEAGFTEVTHTVEIFGRCDRHPSPTGRH